MTDSIVSCFSFIFLTISYWILDQCLAMLTEVSLESGISFSPMEDEVHAGTIDYGDISQKWAGSPEESDWDTDTSDEERQPLSESRPKPGNIYSAYAQLHLYNKYKVVSIMTAMLIFFTALENAAMINGHVKHAMPTCTQPGICNYLLSLSVISNGSTMALST